MNTYGISGFAHWAAYLVNNDKSGLTGRDIADIHLWADENGVDVCNCLGAEDDGIGWVKVGPAEIQGECAFYTFTMG